jgi:hypothetical protein
MCTEAILKILVIVFAVITLVRIFDCHSSPTDAFALQILSYQFFHYLSFEFQEGHETDAGVVIIYIISFIVTVVMCALAIWAAVKAKIKLALYVSGGESCVAAAVVADHDFSSADWHRVSGDGSAVVDSDHCVCCGGKRHRLQ